MCSLWLPLLLPQRHFSNDKTLIPLYTSGLGLMIMIFLGSVYSAAPTLLLHSVEDLKLVQEHVFKKLSALKEACVSKCNTGMVLL